MATLVWWSAFQIEEDEAEKVDKVEITQTRLAKNE